MMRRILPVALFLLFISGFCGGALAGALEMRGFQSLPVMDEGRIKPLESFSRAKLRDFSGRESLGGRSASEWLALALFDPAAAAEEPVFAISDATLKAQLGLQADKKLFSLEELGPGLFATREQVAAWLGQDRKTLRPDELALVLLHERVAGYTQLLRSFSAVLPLDVDLPKIHAGPQKVNGNSFIDLAPMEKRLEKDLEAIIAKKGREPDTYDAGELAIAKAVFQIEALRAGGEGNTIFRVLPGRWDGGRTWLSPWESLLRGQGSPETAQLLGRWRVLAEAYRAGDAKGWKAGVEALRAETLKQAMGSADSTRLRTEVFYRILNPYFWIIALYGLGFLCAVFAIRNPHRLLRLGTIFAGFFGVMLHVAAIVARIYILGRPPVGTLYESVLFVSLICAVPGVIAAMRKQVSPLSAAGFLSAAGLLFIAPVALPQGDSLEVLVAVLNTNFWLATHVICITIGYGVSILAAGMAHTLLFVYAGGGRGPGGTVLQKNMRLVSLAALFFMTLGTVLGGIWADQSWGRFWGWDPKENGALLIVLWLIWAQHGRLSGRVDRTGFAALMALLSVIVALSWFGVNLLNVGLHSYGFTSGMAGGLAVFCALEIALISGLYLRARMQQRRADHEN